MIVTTSMLRELEKAISEDAQAEIRVYAGGCDIRVKWNSGLREANLNLGAEQLAQVQTFREEKMRKAWNRVIERLCAVRDIKPS